MNTKRRTKSKDEQLRRQRLGDLRRLYQHRYRRTLFKFTDDDAGREDLRELLLVHSFHYNPERMMRNAVENWAPWMDKIEAAQIIDDVNQTPEFLRKPSARELGDRLRLTDFERQQLAIGTIRPFDVTDEELAARRKAKDAVRKWRKRKAENKTPREAWLANCYSRTKPWEKRKRPISRATWYRERAKDRTKVIRTGETSVSAVKLTTGVEQPVSLECAESHQKRLPRKQVADRKQDRKQTSEKKRARG
jgi:hypothetical protein